MGESVGESRPSRGDTVSLAALLPVRVGAGMFERAGGSEAVKEEEGERLLVLSE